MVAVGVAVAVGVVVAVAVAVGVVVGVVVAVAVGVGVVKTWNTRSVSILGAGVRQEPELTRTSRERRC